MDMCKGKYYCDAEVTWLKIRPVIRTANLTTVEELSTDANVQSESLISSTCVTKYNHTQIKVYACVSLFHDNRSLHLRRHRGHSDG